MESGPLHRRGVYSHSAQGSAFEVSGIRGPCFSFFPSHRPHPLSSCCGPMRLSRSKYYPASNLACPLPLLFSMSFFYRCFGCYYLIFPKLYSCSWKQEIPHLGLRPKEASHLGLGLRLPSLSVHGTEPPPCCPCRRESCYCSTVSARGDLATVAVLLQNPMEKVMTVSPP